ncbi:MerR family transcriptional regulator [Arsenicicoccus piscis]|uniref:MerR family transcriptional regulator n=1 Tax=Arsenicicoccus piscis TaxID=673954 RepID=A0ABQ6HHJ2_9MICO|nr:MerR family transcriptional regulator [Arsenicicoccus piscis]MCH8627556.1 MerR family transcriptional regulator [Arsenicicoccus piscis]GMA18031.1 hypothetical protein GCM10025862_00520 [Arsenicicoccus piscis]GMA21743.1 hypothetical protein GCM10025862_37640 [Arsenicicoccus piscis]
MFTISKAAQMTGIPAATLRAWEKRYGMILTTRTPKGYRLYSPAAIDILRRMAHLLDTGWSPSNAAASLESEILALHHRGTDRPSVEDLLEAARGMDVMTVERCLDHALRPSSLEDSIDSWLMPAVLRIGDECKDGTIGVAAANLVSTGVRQRLAAAYIDASPIDPIGELVLGLPSGCFHEMGLLSFAVLARRAGFTTTYLGADTPPASYVDAALSRRPMWVIIAMPTEADIDPVATTVAELQLAVPDTPIGVGGHYQDRAPAGATRLGHNILAAVRRLRPAQARRRDRSPRR